MENNLGLKIILLTLFALGISFAIYEMTKTPLYLKRRIKIAAAGSVILLVYSWFFLQSHSVFFSQEGILSEKIVQIKSLFKEKSEEPIDLSSPKNKIPGLVLINTSQNHTLKVIGDLEDSTTEVLTDRKMILNVTSWLAAVHEKLDLVAVDQLFPDPETYDDALCDSILPLLKENKIVLGYYPEIKGENPGFYKRIPPGALGNVDLQNDEPIYYSHRISAAENQLKSLPYQMHCKLEHTNYAEESHGRFLFDTFNTEFTYTNEEVLLANVKSKQLNDDQQNKGNDRFVSTAKPSVFGLGDAGTKDGKSRILQKIDEFKRKKRAVIVFIGSFKDENIDVHQTVYGPLYGTTIVLNEFNYFQKNYHLMSYPELTLYLLTQAVFYFAIIFFMLSAATKKDLRIQHTTRRSRSENHMLSGVLEWIESVLSFVYNEIYYVFLLVMVLVVNVFFHKILNIVGLIYVIPMSAALLRFYIARHTRNGIAVSSQASHSTR